MNDSNAEHDHAPATETGRQDDVRRSVYESAIYLLSKIVPLVFTLLFIKFYTNWFSPEVVGRYETVMALGVVAASLGAGWLQMSLLRLYPQWEKENRLGTLSLSVGIGLLASLLGGAFIFLLVWSLRGTELGLALHLDLIGWASLLFVSQSFFMIASTVLRAQRKAVWFSLASSLTSLLNLVGGAGLTWIFGTLLVCLVCGTSLSLVVPGCLALALGVKALSGGVSSSAETKLAARPGDGANLGKCLAVLLSFGLPLSLNQVCSQLLNLSDRYVILVLRGEAEAGIYSVTYRLADFAVRFVLLALMMSAYTAVTETYERKGREAAERLVSSLSRFYILTAAPVAVGIGLVQQDAMRLFTGPDFIEGASLLVWIAAGDFLLGLSQYQHFGLHLGKRTVRLAVMTFSAALLNLGLNLAFVPVYGYRAAAYSTFVSFAFLAVVAPLLAKPWLTWRVRIVSMARIAVALIVMSLVVFACAFVSGRPLVRLPIQVVAGASAYLLALLVSRELSWDLLRGFKA